MATLRDSLYGAWDKFSGMMDPYAKKEEPEKPMNPELVAKYEAMGYSPEAAREMAKGAMLGEEFKTARDRAKKQTYGTQAGNVFVGDPLGAFMGNFQAQRAQNQLDELAKRGKGIAQTAMDQMARAKVPNTPPAASTLAPGVPTATPESEVMNDMTAPTPQDKAGATVNALRNPQEGPQGAETFPYVPNGLGQGTELPAPPMGMQTDPGREEEFMAMWGAQDEEIEIDPLTGKPRIKGQMNIAR